MKTTLHLHRDVHHPPLPAPPAHASVGAATVRLGLLVSLVAAVLAIVVEAVVSVPAALILIPVVVVGFALSWHASGRDAAPPPRR
jgi:hypothetical protein